VTVNVIDELKGPVPSLFFVWIHQVYEPLERELGAVTPQVLPEQTAVAKYHVSMTVVLDELSTLRRYSVAVASLFHKKYGFPIATVAPFGEMRVAAGGVWACSARSRLSRKATARAPTPNAATLQSTRRRPERFRSRGNLSRSLIMISNRRTDTPVPYESRTPPRTNAGFDQRELVLAPDPQHAIRSIRYLTMLIMQREVTSLIARDACFAT
jgi:hypothetical protein